MICGMRHKTGQESEEVRRRSSKAYIRQSNGVTTVSFGERSIWDLADLRLLREVLDGLVHQKRCEVIGIDMRSVQSLASGFFGILYDMHKVGANVRLRAPHPCVKEMLWFRAFCEHLVDDWYILVGDPQGDVLTDARREWRRNAQPQLRSTRRNQPVLEGRPLRQRSQRTSHEGQRTEPVPRDIVDSKLVPPDASLAIVPLKALGAILELGVGDRGEVVSVKLSASRMTDLEMGRLQCLKGLEHLWLDNTRITDAGLEKLDGQKTLRTLDLLGTAITDEGLRHIASLVNLEELNLSRTSVTGTGLAQLRDLPHLTSLSVYDTAVDDAAIVHLAQMAGLRDLWLAKTQISEEGRARLAAALPDCRIS